MNAAHTSIQPRLARIALAGLWAIASFMIAHPGVALGQGDPDYWKQTPEREAIVNRFVYGQSPQAIPPSYDTVREAEEVLRQQQQTLPTSNPQARSLWAQIRGVTISEGLSSPLRTLGTISLAAGTFEIGWKIGSGINAKFLRIGVPEAIPHTNTDFRGNGFYQEIVWHAAGYSAESTGKVVQPVDGFTWTRYTDSGRYSYWRTGAPESLCDMNRVVPPAGLAIQTSSIAGADCGLGEPRAGTDYHVAYVPEVEVVATAPIEPYTNQPYTNSGSPPTPPTQGSVEDGIEDALDDPENELLRDWLNYQLGSPGAQDPFSDGANVPQPAPAPGEDAVEFADELDSIGLTNVTFKVLSSPAFDAGAVIDVSPDPGTSVEPDEAIEVTVNRTEQRENHGECDRGVRRDPGPPLSGDEFALTDTFTSRDPDRGMEPTDVPLRWGTTGWGFRHIEIGHGWDGGRDRIDTQAALLDGAPEPDQPGSHRFYFFYMGANRTPCTRRVVARFNALTGEPATRGIITSFAHPGWYRRSDFD